MSKGGNFARNLGISSAKCEYIAFLDDDDFFENEKIEVIISYINMYPNIDLLYHRARINMKREGYNYITKPSSYLSNINSLLQKNVIGGTPMVVAKRTSLTAVGGFDIQLPALQDYELWLRLYVNNCKFKFIDRVLTQCNYLTNYKSVSKSLEANKLAIQIIENRYSNLYSKFNFWQKRQYAYNKYKLIVHKMLLNGNYKEAFYYSFKYSIQNLNFLSLLHSLGILFGPRLISILKKSGI
jgi:glycosyltransferase involved in cell wall biosynthesis